MQKWGSKMMYKVQFRDVLADRSFSLETSANSKEDAEQQGRGWAELSSGNFDVQIEFLRVIEHVGL